MKFPRKVSLISLPIILSVITSCETANTVINKNSVEPEREYASLCDVNLVEKQLASSYVRLKANINGFHEVFLTDERCPGPENILQLNLTVSQRNKLVELSNHGRDPHNPNLAGVASVHGLLVVDGGELTQYPPRLVDLSASPDKGEPLIVNRLDFVTIEAYEHAK